MNYFFPSTPKCFKAIKKNNAALEDRPRNRKNREHLRQENL